MEWFKSLFTGNSSGQVSAKKQLNSNKTNTTRQDANEATFKAMGKTNRRKMKIEEELYGNKKKTPPVPPLEWKIKKALKDNNRRQAIRLAKRKKMLEAQLSRLDGQQENVLRNKDLFDEMDLNKDVMDALKTNTRAVKEQVGGLDVLEVEALLAENQELQADVSDITDALAFQGGDSIYDLEGEDYLENLEKEMEEEEAERLLGSFANIPYKATHREEERNTDNNDNNNFSGKDDQRNVKDTW